MILINLLGCCKRSLTIIYIWYYCIQSLGALDRDHSNRLFAWYTSQRSLCCNEANSIGVEWHDTPITSSASSPSLQRAGWQWYTFFSTSPRSGVQRGGQPLWGVWGLPTFSFFSLPPEAARKIKKVFRGHPETPSGDSVPCTPAEVGEIENLCRIVSEQERMQNFLIGKKYITTSECI